jgi:hypothetical protein
MVTISRAGGAPSSNGCRNTSLHPGEVALRLEDHFAGLQEDLEWDFLSMIGFKQLHIQLLHRVRSGRDLLILERDHERHISIRPAVLRDSSSLSSAAQAGRYRVPFDSMIVKDLND